MLDKKGNFSKKGRTEMGGPSTLAGGMMKKGSGKKDKDGKEMPGMKDLFKCMKDVAPAKAAKIKCDIAMEAMKTKYGCDLRGDDGMKAAFAGSEADNLDKQGKTGMEDKMRGFGMSMKMEAMCDKADRLKETLKAEKKECPTGCSKDAWKELEECKMVDAKDIFEGSCKAGTKLTKDNLKKQFPNCGVRIEDAMKKKKMQKKVKGKMKMKVSNK